MPSQPTPPEPQTRVAERLAAARRGRFVGRAAEVAAFRAGLLTAEPPFVVLHLHGPGGVGKTTLLREYARIATECGRAVARIDGRDLEPSPAGFLRAVREAFGLPEGELAATLAAWPGDGVLLVDTYETLAALDTWLRERFLPQLPSTSMVVLAGRNAPAPDWRTDIDWADLTAVVPLGNLRREEGGAYLAARGIPAARHAAALAFTRGHPLALTLVADVLGRGDESASFDPRGEPEVVRVLLARLVRDVPSPRHRRALDLCVLARATTERMVADVLRGDDAPDLFGWLRQISFIEQGPHGIFPHDLAREVLEADARWRDPAAFERLGGRIYAQHLAARIVRTTGPERQRLLLESLYVVRAQRYMSTFFDWKAMEGVYAAPVAAADGAAIVAMVRAHEGEESAAIARHWLGRQPEAFRVFRAAAGECFGFMAHLALDRATPDDLAADPAVAPALAVVRRYGPAAPGETILHARFLMHRDAYQAITAAINLTAALIVGEIMTRPGVAWNFIAWADPDFWSPHFTGLNWPRSPEADFAVGGRRYGTFAHDWRVGPLATWMAGDPPPMPFDRGRNAAIPATPELSQAEFAAAVRQALRDFARPDRLAESPLLRSRLVGGAAGQAGVAALRVALREALDALKANPREVKLHRALWHTFIEPAPTQERAAELLGLPFNTYRYHLTNGIERVAEILWRREQGGAR